MRTAHLDTSNHAIANSQIQPSTAPRKNFIPHPIVMTFDDETHVALVKWERQGEEKEEIERVVRWNASSCGTVGVVC
jgi:hypothetical protein